MFKQCTFRQWLFLLLISIGFSHDIQADEELVVGFYARGPWIIEKNGTFEGPEITLINEITNRLGLKTRFLRAPAIRLFHELDSGNIDIMIGVFRSTEREQYLHYIEPAYKAKSNMAFYVSKDSNTSIKNYQDLYKVRLGALRGAKHFTKFDNDKELNIHLVNAHKDGLKMLAANRIDAFIMTDSEGDYLIHELGLQNQIGASPYRYSQTNPVYIVLAKNSSYAHIHNKLKSVVKDMYNNGEIDNILRQFFEKNKLAVPDYK